MFCYAVLDIHTGIAHRDLWSCRMDMTGWSEAIKAQTENEDQPQLVAELAELRQVV